ncbi:MAG TPA: hypothetical protein VGP68_20785 [Gemmataceae bacterium]|jgi:hypothetical protein|nr:hypothetical protein [Gemmataceae bacterium]
MLAKRLSRYVGSIPASSLLGVAAQNACSPRVSPALLAATVEAAARFTAGPVAMGLISSKVISLTNGVLKAMLLNKLMKTTALLLLCGLFSTGAGVVLAKSRAPSAGEQEQPGRPAQALKEPFTSFQAAEILQNYQLNEASADEKFGNKNIRVQISMYQARIKRLQVNDNDDWTANFRGGLRPYYVLITNFNSGARGAGLRTASGMLMAFGFGKEAQKELAALKNEPRVFLTVEGQCQGRTITDSGKEIVCIKDCKIIEVKEEKVGKGNDVGR